MPFAGASASQTNSGGDYLYLQRRARPGFDAFARRYGCVSGTTGAAAADLVAAFAAPDASGAALLAARSYALGRTKVFLRAESRSALEDARAAALERFYVRVQSAGRTPATTGKTAKI